MRTAPSVLCALILLLAACDPARGIERPLQSVALREGSLEIRYLEPVGAAAFGPHTLRFYFCRQGGERLLAATSLHNDGATPRTQNLTVVDRTDGSVLLTLKGQEQADERWLVESAGGEVGMRKLD